MARGEQHRGRRGHRAALVSALERSCLVEMGMILFFTRARFGSVMVFESSSQAWLLGVQSSWGERRACNFFG